MTPHQVTTGQQTIATAAMTAAAQALATANAAAVTASVALVSPYAAVAFTGSLDISGMAGSHMIDIEVLNLTAASGTPRARIVLEDSVDNFAADILPVCELNIQGPIADPALVAQSWTHAMTPSLRIGVTSAKARLALYKLDGTTATITASARVWN
jgi:hypothetical protein